MSEEETNKPKIIVDDDWKSRAQAEKEQLQQQTQSKQSGDAEPTPPPSEDQSSENVPPAGPLPPASFTVLVTSLATQALATMGQIPGPDGKPVVELDHAKHFIDTLGVLEEKTKGNLTSDEAALLSNAVHELRLMFVMAGKQSAESSNK